MRKPYNQEINLIKILIEKSKVCFPKNWDEKLLVSEMNDGKMGSLIIFPDGIQIQNRIFGKQISYIQFKDVDKVDVIASLNIDSNGELFELDIWKTNFDKLIQLPF